MERPCSACRSTLFVVEDTQVGNSSEIDGCHLDASFCFMPRPSHGTFVVVVLLSVVLSNFFSPGEGILSWSMKPPSMRYSPAEVL